MARQILITATRKSSGKTLVSMGLCRALHDRGMLVQPFKKGPDYIDPQWLARSAGRPCFNLDFNTQEPSAIRDSVGARAAGAHLALIEGTKGLFDGIDPRGTDCTAALAELLAAPAVLVVDCQGMTRGIAPLLLGYRQFPAQVPFAGVILNRVADARHEAKLRTAVETYTDFLVLGALRRTAALTLDERHLGLIPANEAEGAERRIIRAASAVADQVDLDALSAAARPAPAPPSAYAPSASGGTPVTIAFPRDEAFGFYYADDLDALERAGARLVAFDTLHDSRLPPTDGMFIGGGFPEARMDALERNTELRGQIRAAIESGMPTYAECGGLIYLARELRWGNHRCAMTGALPISVSLRERPAGRGLVRLTETAEMPWPGGPPAGELVAAHEFHYSVLDPPGWSGTYAYRVARGHGIDGGHDGMVYRRVLASYAHLRATGRYPWTARFVAYVRACVLRTATTADTAETG